MCRSSCVSVGSWGFADREDLTARYRSSVDEALSLERHGALARFDARTEAEYRRWLRREIRSLSATMGTASLAFWLAVPLIAAVALPPNRGAAAIAIVSWGINAPLLAGSLIYLRRSSTHQWLLGLATAVVTVTLSTACSSSDRRWIWRQASI